MAFTLTLNDNWDIFVDASGNIATSDDTYAIAQNAANAVRLFTGDAYFNITRGIPHFDIELGQKDAPARSTLVNRIRKSVLAGEGVSDAEVSLEYDERTRVYGGNIIITTVTGNTIRIEL